MRLSARTWLVPSAAARRVDGPVLAGRMRGECVAHHVTQILLTFGRTGPVSTDGAAMAAGARRGESYLANDCQ